MKNKLFLNLEDISEEIVSAEKYIEIMKKNPSSIESSEIVPPKLGTNDFGKFKVKYITPKYRYAY